MTEEKRSGAAAEVPVDTAGPGDCHIHMILDGVFWKDAIARHRECPDEKEIRQVLGRYRELGVTYLRDGGDTCGVCRMAARLAPEYGIEYRMPVFAIHRRGRYGSIVGFPYEDMGEFRQLVRRAAREGADFIKVMVSGILDFQETGRLSCEPLPPEEIRGIVEVVHEADMAVMLHINGAETVLAAVEAGADSLEHGFFMDGECAAALGEHRETVWIPSIAPVANQIGRGRFPDGVLTEITRRQQEQVRRAVKAGGRVALGSDAGAWGVFHGRAIADELAYLTEALEGEMPVPEIRRMLRENEEFVRERFRRQN